MSLNGAKSSTKFGVFLGTDHNFESLSKLDPLYIRRGVLPVKTVPISDGLKLVRKDDVYYRAMKRLNDYFSSSLEELADISLRKGLPGTIIKDYNDSREPGPDRESHLLALSRNPLSWKLRLADVLLREVSERQGECVQLTAAKVDFVRTFLGFNGEVQFIPPKVEDHFERDEARAIIGINEEVLKRNFQEIEASYIRLEAIDDMIYTYFKSTITWYENLKWFIAKKILFTTWCVLILAALLLGVSIVLNYLDGLHFPYNLIMVIAICILGSLCFGICCFIHKICWLIDRQNSLHDTTLVEPRKHARILKKIRATAREELVSLRDTSDISKAKFERLHQEAVEAEDKYGRLESKALFMELNIKFLEDMKRTEAAKESLLQESNAIADEELRNLTNCRDTNNEEVRSLQDTANITAREVRSLQMNRQRMERSLRTLHDKNEAIRREAKILKKMAIEANRQESRSSEEVRKCAEKEAKCLKVVQEVGEETGSRFYHLIYRPLGNENPPASFRVLTAEQLFESDPNDAIMNEPHYVTYYRRLATVDPTSEYLLFSEKPSSLGTISMSLMDNNLRMYYTVRLSLALFFLLMVLVFIT